MTTELFQDLLDKKISKDEFYESVKKNDNLIPTIIDGVSSNKATIRYSCAKILMDISEEKPEKIYNYMDFFIDLLDSKYRILTWNAIITIANLTKVDIDNKFDKIFSKYFNLLNNDYMVTVANVVGNSSRIADNKPYLLNEITDELLRVDKIKLTPHLTEECRRVIIEKAIKFFDNFYEKIEDKQSVLSFVKKHVSSPRISLKNEALRFLEKWI